MGGIKKVFNNFGITAKLVCLCVVFGIIPMTAIGFIGFDAANHMEENVGKKFEIVAKNIADKIDRNLFERYGDVQAFAQNRENQNRIQWGNPLHMNDITTAMNGYVATYGIYYLTIMVDTEGTPLAVNSKDADGNPIASEHLMNKSYKNTSWFKAVSAGNFTTKMAFTAPGNDISTGTFIEDVHVDKDVKSVYPRRRWVNPRVFLLQSMVRTETLLRIGVIEPSFLWLKRSSSRPIDELKSRWDIRVPN